MDNSNNNLAIALSAAVPLRIMQLQERGGPTDADWAFLKEFSEELGEPGNAEALLFQSSKPGQTATMFNHLARVLAIMSYVPGGVLFAGARYETRQEQEQPDG